MLAGEHDHGRGVRLAGITLRRIAIGGPGSRMMIIGSDSMPTDTKRMAAKEVAQRYRPLGCAGVTVPPINPALRQLGVPAACRAACVLAGEAIVRQTARRATLSYR
ncbi:MAG: hypothetical protein J2P48_14680 [Alphaproteobacteria bacterium]|nr:hypothetical protein [Alphaproteobacteria bacterium]